MLVFTASFRVACMSVTVTLIQAMRKEAVNTSIKGSEEQTGQGLLPLSLTLTLTITLTRAITRILPMQARLGMRSFLLHLPFVSRDTTVHY
jgi:hypothetical protein